MTNNNLVSLKLLALAGLGWNSMSGVGIQGLALLRITLVAHWLGPEEIGIFGLAVASIAAVKLLSQFGLQTAYTSLSPNSPTVAEAWLHSVWWLNLLLCFSVTLVAFTLAYPATLLIGEPRLLLPMLVLSLSPTLRAFSSPELLSLEKQGKFRPIAILELCKAAILTALVLAIAMHHRSVWALIWGNLLAEAAGALLSYAFARKAPRLIFDKSVLKQVFSFGKYLLVIAIFTYVTSQADDLIVGALLGVEALGLYYLAYRIAMLPVMLLGSVVSRVLLPIYRVGIDESMSRLRFLWLRSFSLTPWVLVAMLLPVVLYAEEILALLLDKEWHDAAPLVSILAIAAGLRGMVHGVSLAILILKEPRTDARYKMIEALVFLPTLYVGISTLGLTGAALASGLSYGIALVLRICWSSRRLNIAYKELVPAIVWPLVVSGGIVLAWWQDLAGLHSPITGTLMIGLICAAAIAVVLRRKF